MLKAVGVRIPAQCQLLTAMCHATSMHYKPPVPGPIPGIPTRNKIGNVAQW